MAEKKTGLETLFKRTEPRTGAARNDFDLDAGVIKATGIGLKEGELAALELIGKELGELLGTEPVARNAVMRLVLRNFLDAYQYGEITAGDMAAKFERPEKPKAKLKK